MKRADWPHRVCLAFGVALGLSAIALGALLLPLIFRIEFGIPHGLIAAVLMFIGGLVTSECWKSLRGTASKSAQSESAARWHAISAELVEFDRKRNQFPEAAVLEPLVAAARNPEHPDFICNIKELAARYPESLWLRLTLAASLNNSGQFTLAAQQFKTFLDQGSISIQARLLLATVLTDGYAKERNVAEIRILAAQLLALKMPNDCRVEVLDRLACCSFYYECPELLDEAWAWLAEALKLTPDLPTLQGTRAALLIERNQDFAGARPLLEKLLHSSKSASDRGICKLYLALCSKHEGNLCKARVLAEDAVRLHPEPWLLKRKQREFGD